MADSYAQTLIDATFISGEKPDAYKLSGAFEQLKNAVEFIDLAIGDLHSQQVHSGASGTYPLSRYPLTGPNLSRLLGSSEWLNPKMVGRIRTTLSHTFSGMWTWDHEGYTLRGRREFRLPFPPIQFTSAEGEYPVTTQTSMAAADAGDATNFQVTADAGNVMQTRQDDLADVLTAGDYHVSDDGVVTTFSALTGTVTISYKFDTIPDTYDGARFNVIPDFNQSAYCTVTLVSGSTYTIDLPTVAHRVGDHNPLSGFTPNHWVHRHWSGSVTHPMEGYQLTLPLVLTSALADGDEIPAGFIYLYDEGSDSIVPGTSFVYKSATQVQSTGAALTTGSGTYRLVVVGCDATQTLYHVRRGYHIHNHSGKVLQSSQGDEPGIWTGERISHIDLLDLVDSGSAADPGFTVSSIGPLRNPHPQYLHRLGYQYGEGIADGGASTGNVDNTMLGTLVMAGTGGGLTLTVDSYPIRFGSVTDGGPLLYYEQAEDNLLVSAKPFRSLLGMRSGANGTSPIKWLYGTKANISNTGADNVDVTCPIDLAIAGVTAIVGVTGGIYDPGTAGFYPFGANPGSAALEVAVVSTGIVGADVRVNISYGTTLRNANEDAHVIVYYI